MNAREFMATYKSGPASENTYKGGDPMNCTKCGEPRSALQHMLGNRDSQSIRYVQSYHRFSAEGSDTACSTPSSHGSPESSSSVDDIIAGILECLGKADGLWLSRGEILLLIARTKGEL